MDKNTITVGQTKTIGMCSVGAICRAGSECFVPCDISFWKDKAGKPLGKPIAIVREHLKIWLKHKGFQDVELLKPPTLTHVKNKLLGNKIPVVRFPSWMVCQKCGRLHYLPWMGKKSNSVEELKCDTSRAKKICNGKLEFVTWVLVSGNGWLDDLPWANMAHYDEAANKNCRSKDQLTLKRDPHGRLTLKCDACQSQPLNLSGLRNKDFFTNRVQTMRSQPWLLERKNLENDPPVAMPLTDARIHFADIASALDIPPESRINEHDIRAKIRQHDDYQIIKDLKNNNSRTVKRTLKKIARHFQTSKDEVKKALTDLNEGWPNYGIQADTVKSENEMLEAEYKAICTEYKDIQQHERFITEHQTAQWKDYLESEDIPEKTIKTGKAIEKLIIINRLREIQVFCGFTRQVGTRGNLIGPALGKKTDWLPACELYGEGIFFSLDEKKVSQWESDPLCRDRAKTIQKRLKTSAFVKNQVKATPRFILLHTIAHQIIRELEFTSGYPVSSIKEKIFCSETINGILIYVAVPNKMGSLGGLSEHGKPDSFFKLWIKAMAKADHCTYDPICAEHEGQGPDQLNRAACHGCSLLPEVSCIYNNCLLDRQFIIGNGVNHMKGFISFIQNQP
ncbi:DrmB family protein [Desulfobacula toluolica]|uniref:Conserved uncharacterized protein n=1 Tax=Desulfobacula toluolica (strain DSM 7467 / Tol2) TaxID=651182 RepID=K0N5I5_DESTT|nr:DrmB family protein [Desulfobacula toluolica]CCK79334.1 conserved uncharacterized protein [Desulfobacula toluolica Tol2]